MKKLEIKKNIQKLEDKNLSFRAFELSEENLSQYLKPHKKDHFFILVIEKGKLQLHIEDKIHYLKTGQISVVFPEQVHFTSDLSLGDIEKAFDDGAKDAIFNNQGIITTEYICNSLRRRKENKME